MRLNEIVDPEDREQRLSTFRDQLNKQFAPQKQDDPAMVDARRAQYSTHEATRQEIEKLAVEIAQQFSGEQFEQFAQTVRQRIPNAEKFINLQYTFDVSNPERKQTYGAGSGPTEPGISRSGARNWTGD